MHEWSRFWDDFIPIRVRKEPFPDAGGSILVGWIRFLVNVLRGCFGGLVDLKIMGLMFF